MKGAVKFFAILLFSLIFVQWGIPSVSGESKIQVQIQSHEVHQTNATPTTIIEAPIRYQSNEIGGTGSGSGNSGGSDSGSGDSGNPGSGSGDSGNPNSGSGGSEPGNSNHPGSGSGSNGNAGSGSGNSNGSGSGSGDSGRSGSGFGNSSGSGDSDGNGSGSGNSDGNDSGSGNSDGNGSGSGNSDGNGSGSGNSDGSGNGSSQRDGTGTGTGEGDGNESSNNDGGEASQSWRERLVEFGKSAFQNTKDFLLDSANIEKIGRGLLVGVIGTVAAGLLVAGAVALGVIAAPSLLVIGAAAVVALAVGVTYSFLSGDNFSYLNGILASTLGAFSVFTLSAIGAGTLLRGIVSGGTKLVKMAAGSIKTTVTSKWFTGHLSINTFFSYQSWRIGTESTGFPSLSDIALIGLSAVASTFIFDKIGGAVKASVGLKGFAGFSLKGFIDGTSAVVAQIASHRILRVKDKDTPITAFVTGSVFGRIGDRVLKYSKNKLGTTLEDVKRVIRKPFTTTSANSNTRNITNNTIENLTKNPDAINPNTLKHFQKNPRLSSSQYNELLNRQISWDRTQAITESGEKVANFLTDEALKRSPLSGEQNIDTVEKIKEAYQSVDEKISEPLEKGINRGTEWIENKVK